MRRRTAGNVSPEVSRENLVLFGAQAGSGKTVATPGVRQRWSTVGLKASAGSEGRVRKLAVRPHRSWERLGRKVRAARHLPLSVWRFLPSAYAWVMVAALGLRLVGFQRTARLLATGLAAAGRTDASLTAIARAVDVAARHQPWRVSCLARSLALRRLLRQLGHDAQLRIGVQRSGDELHAHAWVEVDGRPLGESGDALRDFSVLEGSLETAACSPSPEHSADSAGESSSLAAGFEENDGASNGGIQ